MNYEGNAYQAPSGQWSWEILRDGEHVVHGAGYESEADAAEAMQEQLASYTSVEAMEATQVSVCSDRALQVWGEVRHSCFTLATHEKLSVLKRESHTDYCMVLGLIFGIAIYRSGELPEGAQGPDDSEYCVTVPSDDLDPFPGELPVSRDPHILWVRAVEQWDLEERFEDALMRQQD